MPGMYFKYIEVLDMYMCVYVCVCVCACVYVCVQIWSSTHVRSALPPLLPQITISK